MEFILARDAKDFLRELYERSCPMHVVKIRTALLTKDNVIDVNIAGKAVDHNPFGSVLFILRSV